MSQTQFALINLGRRATAFYQQQLQQRGVDPLVIETYFDSMINPFLPEFFELVEPRLMYALEQCVAADVILLPNITMHQALDQLYPKGCQFPVVHAVHASIAHLQADNCREVILIGSRYSMNAPYLRDQLESAGIEVWVPEEADQQIIDQLRQKIYAGLEDPVNLRSLLNALEKYARGGEVLLACSELSLFADQVKGVRDMARIQIEAALQQS